MRCIGLICLLFLPLHAAAQEGEGVEGIEGGTEGGEADEPDTISEGPANALGEYDAKVERAEGPPFKVFKGETLDDVVREMGKNPVGHTHCSPDPKLDWDRKGKGKKVAGCKITVTCTVRLPQWANRDKRPESAQAEWDRFREAVDAHEQGHVEAVRPIYEGLCNAVKGKSMAEAGKIFNKATADAAAAERAHDAKTDHGRNTGSKLDGSKDPRQSPPKTNTLGMEGEGGEAPAEGAAEAPAQEAPAEEAPAQEAPAQEAPADE